MKIKQLVILILAFKGMMSFAQDNNTWRGLKIEAENRCSPYSGTFFNSTEETDIEHIVSLSEAHDSGLCSADKETKNRFASDILNLTLASPTVNRDEKLGHDASGWLPEKNQCWFANKVIEVKKAYNLTVDSKELIALEKVISECSSFEIVFFKNNLSEQNSKPHTTGITEDPNVKKNPYETQKLSYEKKPYNLQKVSYTQKPYVEPSNSSADPNVKKSKSGICHSKSSSSHYSRTKNFTAYQSLELCLKSGGRCPKRDSQCQRAIASSKESPYKTQKVSYEKKPYNPQKVSYTQKPYVEPSNSNADPNVKKSKSGICHSKSSSSHYSRTKNFTAYQSLELCLNSGGRCPKRDSACNSMRIPASH